jgi:hypothetical protein
MATVSPDSSVDVNLGDLFEVGNECGVIVFGE